MLWFLSGFWLLQVLLYLEWGIIQLFKLPSSCRPKTKLAHRSGGKVQAHMCQGLYLSCSLCIPFTHQCLVHTILSNSRSVNEGRSMSIPKFWSVLQHPTSRSPYFLESVQQLETHCLLFNFHVVLAGRKCVFLKKHSASLWLPVPGAFPHVEWNRVVLFSYTAAFSRLKIVVLFPSASVFALLLP